MNQQQEEQFRRSQAVELHQSQPGITWAALGQRVWAVWSLGEAYHLKRGGDKASVQPEEVRPTTTFLA